MNAEMSHSKLPFEFLARVIHDWASGSVLLQGSSESGGSSIAPLNCRAENLISRRDGKAVDCKFTVDSFKEYCHTPVLPTNLSCTSGLTSDPGAEGVDFFDDEFLHTLDRILLLESEVKFLR